MSNNNFRPLLPAGGTSPQAPTPSRPRDLVPKQPHVTSACSQCRKSKSKCSGEKPQCARCRSRNLLCEYDADLAGIGLSELRKRHRETVTQRDALQGLLYFMTNQPEGVARDILRRLRTTNDPESLLNLVTRGDLLQQAHVVSTVGDECHNIRDIEESAIQESAIKVSSRPWTGIAGDGVVSHLISSFMEFDQPFLFSFIDKDRFVEDMRAGSPERARYCSPFLVNAICALRSYTSRFATAFNRVKSTDLGEAFLDEAKRLLNLEGGRVSLPTVQGLVIVFMCCASQGRDRAGRIFRYMAYDMLKRLHLIRAQKDHDPMDEEGHKWSQAASRASWGLYCFESVISFAYAQQSLIARPTCPRTFLVQRSSRWIDSEFDNSLILDAMCDLSVIYNEVMSYHLGGNYKLGSEVDLSRRSQLLARIRDWRMGLTGELHVSNNPSMQVYMLRSYEDQVICSVVKDIEAETIMPSTDLAVKDITLSCCIRSLEGLNKFVNESHAGLYSSFIIFPLYCTAVILVHVHKCEATNDLFANACHHLALQSKYFMFTAYLLQAIKVLTEKLDINIPSQAAPYFQALDLPEENLQDVPITFVIPDHEHVAKELNKQEASESLGIQIGALIADWSWRSMR